MELLKKINNNFVVGRDSNGKIVIVSGKGLGFEKMPCVIKNMEKISRTYYDVDERYIGLIEQLPDDIVQLSVKISDYASAVLQQKLNPNLFFTLADHINFALKRAKQGISIHFGIGYEMKYLHPAEMEIGEKAVRLIEKITKEKLPEDEASVIATHILDAENFNTTIKNKANIDDFLEDICSILERILEIKINKQGFSYCRFVTHIQYLLHRRDEKSEITSDNKKMYEEMTKQFPKTYTCVVEMKRYMKGKMAWDISEEEILYLMLHINRLCNNEDCNH